MTLDLKLVESFVAVAETLSFSVAAERLNTVQSAISTHITQLERQVRRPLVERGRGKAVALTPEGAGFLVQARRLLALADDIVRSPSGAGDARPLRLGTSVTFALSVAPRALAAFALEAETAPVTVRTARSHELMNLLGDGEIDVALIYDQGAHPARRLTVETGLSWTASKGFSLPVREPLKLAFLDDARDLRRHAFAALDQSGAFRTSLITHPDPVGLRAVVLAGQAVTVLPAIAIAAPLLDVGDRLDLPKPGALPVSVYASTRSRKDQIDAFIRCLGSVLEKRHQPAPVSPPVAGSPRRSSTRPR
jgi:DNA-binding transcriptional LysR family regulator